MYKAPTLLLNLLHSGKAPSEHLWDSKRIIIINFIILVAVPVFLLFTYLNLQLHHLTFALSNIINVILLLSTFFYFRFNRNIKHASTGILLSLVLTHTTALFEGGIANTGFFWFFFFPFFAIMLKGHKTGLYWVLGLLSIILSMYIYQGLYDIELPYEAVLLIVLIISLSIETIVALFVESVRMKYHEELLGFNTKLEEKVILEVEKNIKKDQLLQQQAKMAAMGEMTNYIAHQWKQPLSTISAIIQTMSVQEELGTLNHKLMQDDFKKMNTQITHMTQTMIDFNNFTKPNQPKENFNLLSVIQESIDMISPMLLTRGITLDTRLSVDVAIVFGQRNLLTHVLLNLMNNAKDALISQNIKDPKIFISLNENATELRVRDNGNGVDPSIESSIFDEYSSTKGNSNGGVGLHMCQRIVEESFNGVLELDNSTQGACFIIHLKTSSSEK